MTIKIDNLKEFDSKLEDGEFLCFSDVRDYIGVFTGKIVKRDPDYTNYGSFEDFKKGEKVLIFKIEDYKKWRKGVDFILEDIRKTREKYKD